MASNYYANNGIKNCPACGGRIIIEPYYVGMGHSAFRMAHDSSIQNNMCDYVKERMFDMAPRGFDSVSEAIERWNEIVTYEEEGAEEMKKEYNDEECEAEYDDEDYEADECEGGEMSNKVIISDCMGMTYEMDRVEGKVLNRGCPICDSQMTVLGVMHRDRMPTLIAAICKMNHRIVLGNEAGDAHPYEMIDARD